MRKPEAIVWPACVISPRRARGVYEPFSGSDTTIIPAEMTGCAVHTIEIAPAYVDVAVKRWQDLTGRDTVLDGDGRSFDDVAAQGRGQGRAPRSRPR